MNKMQGKVIEVSKEYEIRLENNENWIEPTEEVKKYINKSLEGKEVDVTLQDNKIIFIKVIDGGGSRDNGVESIAERINWNIGSLALVSKLRLFYDLETSDRGKTEELEQIYQHLKKDVGKYLESLKKIKEEQEK